VVAMHDCGDHTIFVGHITLMTSDERPPLLYHASHFAALVPLRESSPSLPEFW
jgi:flavin reductase (DIM6/NTAB) family NADH-FMN oxidoreductase RutF